MAKATTYDKTQKSAAIQTRIEDCFAAKYGVTSAEVDDTFISDKQEEFVDNVVNAFEYKETKVGHVHTPTT